MSHVLDGPTGTATAACSSAPSANWYVPSGSTRTGHAPAAGAVQPLPERRHRDGHLRHRRRHRGRPTGLRRPGDPRRAGDRARRDRRRHAAQRSWPRPSRCGRAGSSSTSSRSADGSAGTAKGLAAHARRTRAARRPGGSPTDRPPHGAKTQFVRAEPGLRRRRRSRSRIRLDRRAERHGVAVRGHGGSPARTRRSTSPGRAGCPSGSASPPSPPPTTAGPSSSTGSSTAQRAGHARTASTSRSVPRCWPRRWLVPLGSSDAVAKATLIVTNLSSTQSVHVERDDGDRRAGRPARGDEPGRGDPRGRSGAASTVPAGTQTRRRSRLAGLVHVRRSSSRNG